MIRIENVQKQLEKWDIDLLVVDHPIDLFYLTGQELSTGRLIITLTDATLYVDGRYYEGCKENAPIPVVLYSKDHPYPTFPSKRIGFDAHTTSYDAYERLSALKGERIPLPAPIKSLRAVKDAEEIDLLRQAAELGSRGYDFVLASLKEGVTEKELAIELELFWKKAGGERLAFAPHIAFGANSAHPHYHPGNRPLKQGDLVLIDIGVVLSGYHSDMTRVLFFGEPDPRLEKIYAIVEAAQQKALELCRPGTPLHALDEAARSHIASEGYGEHFSHSLGHGVGLEIHELPWVRSGAEGELEVGMVLTIEPGIYIPGLGGVRLEDTVCITESGYENLTH